MIEYDGDDPRAVISGATPFLQSLGLVTGGWLMARSAAIASAAEEDPEFYSQNWPRLVFTPPTSPLVAACAQAAMVGSEDIMALPAEAF